MELRVVDPNSTCTTLVLYNLGYFAGPVQEDPLGTFKENARRAVKEFDRQNGDWFDELSEADCDYDYKAHTHGCIIATTVPVQAIDERMKHIGFAKVGESHPTKTGATLTMWYQTVENFLKKIKE